MDNFIGQIQNENPWLIISASVLDKEVEVNLSLKDTTIYFLQTPGLRNIDTLKHLSRMDSVKQ